MVDFLSDEWLAAIEAAALPADAALDFTLEQVVTGGPRGDIRYRLVVAGGRLVVDHEGREPDATLRLSWDTAVALVTGRRTAGDAFAAGEVRFRGDVTRLQQAAAALTALAEAMARLGLETTFPAVR